MRVGPGIAAFLFLISSEAQQIEPGHAVNNELAAGETRSYEVSLAAGDFLRFTLESKATLGARLLRPGGDAAVAVDDVRQHEQPLTLSLIARSAGVHRLALQAAAGTSGGKYTLLLETRPGGPHDNESIDAESALREGRILLAGGTAASRRAALPKFSAAIPLARAAADLVVEKNALRSLGRTHNLLGESPLAIKAFGDVLDFARKNKDRPLEAEALNNVGLEHSYLGDYTAAVTELKAAIAAWQELGNDGARVTPTNNLALAYIYLGELDNARGSYEESFRILSKQSDPVSLGYARAGIASISLLQGRYQNALNDYAQAFEIWHQAGSRQNEGIALGNMGVIYMHLGEPRMATRTFQQALEIRRAVGDRASEANALQNLGSAAQALGDRDGAASYFKQAFALAEATGRRRDQAAVLNRLGALASESAHSTDAMDQFTRARGIAHELGDRIIETIATLGLAREKLAQQQPAEALKLADEALQLAEAGGFRPEQEGVFVTMARAEAALGRLDAARERMAASLEIAESIRSGLAGGDFRRSYFAGVRNRYDLLIDILMRQGRAAEAFTVSERARARSLLELLGESRSEIQEGVDPLLLDRERRIRAALRVKAAAPEPEVQKLLLEYREVSNAIRAQSPRYAALTFPEPLSLAEVQRSVLDSETLLLEYALGEERSYVWAVSPGGVVTRELPARSKIEAAARLAYRDLSARQDTGAAAALSRMLVSPIAGELGRKRLAIVTEGALQYIPFAALPGPNGLPLVASHDIVHIPSASTLAVLREQIRGRRTAPLTAAVFGDPVFSRDDPRVSGSSAGRGAPITTASLRGESAGTPELERSAEDTGAGRFDRLPTTRAEAEAITGFAGAAHSRIYLDFDATRDAAVSPDLQNYRIIHFATHGLLNNRHPELSGLVFSLVDRQGQSRNGFLQSFEVYNLRLAADLVVLSACQTALGNDVKGEGLLGLSRGFMYAGAPRVLASLWKVPDAASGELMKHFYRALLVDAMRPAAALRAAQAAMRKEPRTASPYYWAGFILQGEWN